MLAGTEVARAYDLSRQDIGQGVDIERGFVTGQISLWLPGDGPFYDYHQTSLDFGAEFGFRVASVHGHNFFVVAGMTISPQKLDPRYVDPDYANSVIWVGFAGVRYIPAMLCIGDGVGCPFAELRFGLMFEHDDGDSEYDGPTVDFAVQPGIGYRFRFGEAVQVGARMDVSFIEDEDTEYLGWVTFGAFAGFSW
jgi:hypothetical protein